MTPDRFGGASNGKPIVGFRAAGKLDAHLASDLTTYAHGVLVLWARKDSPAQPVTLNSLTNPAVSRIAIANDRHAPYGKAAVAT